MSCLKLKDGACSAVISTRGGAIWSFDYEHRQNTIPILNARGDRERDKAAQSGCFPLVPFGNRIRENRFSFEGKDYSLHSNTDSDPLYLHGDGWLSDWTISQRSGSGATLDFEFDGKDRSPYAYCARQNIRIRDDSLILGLSVMNTGAVALPFGIGWHPFFTLTPDTHLKASATAYWQENEHHLPTKLEKLPVDLDFNQPGAIPDRWINNGFEGWDNRAEITWPEQGIALQIDTSREIERYVLYRPDHERDPQNAGTFFCFEPMSHAIDAHNQAGGGGLQRLAPGGTLSGTMTLTPRPTSL
ncbi:aldose 1-epimerase [Cohaesibacter sp. ES.047]|uniref:aldose 1-epimerase n=1 Tax=Cohaesibacter sp. ES.047 TaxID=1798205 RepID=UPI000BC0DB28|nr:aldose 1-epimerase [Cohaesibacter sp. ES.047]SNY93367.1 aldose 1-epimerase [Cohaesibacter sp. ES.047]